MAINSRWPKRMALQSAGLTSTEYSYVLLGPFCFTSTETRLLIRDGDGGGGGEEGERVNARPRIPPEKDRRDCGPPPEQWKC